MIVDTSHEPRKHDSELRDMVEAAGVKMYAAAGGSGHVLLVFVDVLGRPICRYQLAADEAIEFANGVAHVSRGEVPAGAVKQQ